MDVASAVVQQLKATHSGDPWYGRSRTALLTSVTAGQAASHPVRGVRSIWELVLHMTAWTNEVRRRLDGRAPGEPLEGDWPAVGPVSNDTWRAALADLDTAHAALMDAIGALSIGRWEETVRSSDETTPDALTVGGLLIGLAQHDAYHTAQVALLRRAIEG